MLYNLNLVGRDVTRGEKRKEKEGGGEMGYYLSKKL